MFKGRSTIDIVVILLTLTIGSVLILATIGIIIGKLFIHDIDVARGGEAIQGIVTTLVGALVGFIGGRAQGKMEGNGVK